MSAFEDEISLDMSKIPAECLERAYWRRRLPPAFRFFLEMLSRELLTSTPSNIFAHSAGFFEELLIQRDMELSMLPYESYLDRLMKRRGLQPTYLKGGRSGPQMPGGGNGKSSVPGTPRTPGTPATPAADAPHKCARCGGFVCSQAPGSTPQPPAAAPPAKKAPDTDSMNGCPNCSRCGRKMRSQDPSVGEPYTPGEGMDAGAKVVQDNVYPQYQIIPFPYKKDAWGMLMTTSGRKKDDEYGDLINSRSLSILMDY